MTDKEAMKLALEALQTAHLAVECDMLADEIQQAITALREALAEQPAQQQEPVLQDIEQYRLQMAGICTAAIGYWKEDDGIHPDYDTVALRDVAKLYAKYDELYRAQPAPQRKPLTDEQIEELDDKVRQVTIDKGSPVGWFAMQLARAIEAAHGIGEIP